MLLTIHFPKLRILWCSSPSEAAEIFEEIKENSPQPDAAVATSIKSDQVIENDDMKFNPILSDILLKIPGVNSKNLDRLMLKCTSLYDLCQKSEEELTEILENSRNAKLIYEFLNKSIKSMNNSYELDFEDLNEFNSIESNSKKVTIESGPSTGKKQFVKTKSSNSKTGFKKTSSFGSKKK